MATFSTEAHNAAEINPITVSHTASGADRFALIAVMNDGTAPAVAYGSQTPTLIASNGRLHLYGLIAPATSAQSVSADSGSSQMQAIIVASFVGVNQSTPTRAPALADNDEQATITASPASQTGDLVVDVALMINLAMTAAAGQTRIVDMDDPGVGFLSLGMSTKAGGAASTSMTWEAAETFGDNRQIAAALVPASSGSAGIPGVGSALIGSALVS